MPDPRAEVKAKLIIDDDDLDQCLVDQPSYFEKAATAFSEAKTTRDTLKLELKELTAELDQSIRARALATEEKLSETALSSRITITPRVKELNRKLLQANRAADDWEALKESYVQRSYSLKDLTAIQLSRQSNLGVERGAIGARRDVGARAQAQAEQIRRERYRPNSRGE
jgi:hypothetical protein